MDAPDDSFRLVWLRIERGTDEINDSEVLGEVGAQLRQPLREARMVLADDHRE
jgi:hypothetical protein